MKKNTIPSKRKAMNITTGAAYRATTTIAAARTDELKLIGVAITEAYEAYLTAEVARLRAVESRRTGGTEKPASRAKLVTKLRKVLDTATIALRAAGTKLAREIANDLDLAAAASKLAYQTRRDLIAARDAR